MEILPVTSNGPDIILRANSYEIIPVQTQSISTDFSGASLDLLIQPKQSWSWSLKSEASTGKSQFSVKLTATKGCSFFSSFVKELEAELPIPDIFCQNRLVPLQQENICPKTHVRISTALISDPEGVTCA